MRKLETRWRRARSDFADFNNLVFADFSNSDLTTIIKVWHSCLVMLIEKNLKLMQNKFRSKMLRNCFFANTIGIKREKSFAKTYFHDVPPKERKQINKK